MATGPHITALQQQILARIAANKVPGDITYFQNIWDGITFNVGTCAADLAAQEAATSTALFFKTASDTALTNANTALFLEQAALNSRIAAAAALQAQIDALPGAGTRLQRDELAAIAAVRAYYGV